MRNSKKENFPYPQLEIEGIQEQKVLKAVRNLPRELFIAKEWKMEAYSNQPLPIECGQTISQPFIVAYMTEKLALEKTDKVLEIGTGSGFQTAVLAQLSHTVYTIEFYKKLSQKSQKILNKLNYKNIFYKIGDGKNGWPEFAPFDKIIITAVAKELPTFLVQQLKLGGKMILPWENKNKEQYLVLVNKLSESEIKLQQLIPVRFVPLV